ncbi:MAG: dihydroorotate dehydrogenase-like protein [Bacteroidetes bacterium]|nr:dihydroorotate dehydrogenase-like protein [Bacteroidota bacterium]MBL7104006.1 dihydroorotate dehydrogenase-like protein [Bacteroidales bacterium]
MDLTTNYMGLTLKNPIIIGSSGLTNSVEKIKKLENNGAGAVVLKSLFEEQLLVDRDRLIEQDKQYFWYPEAVDYINNYAKEFGIKEYSDLIKNAKKDIDIPIIASINCISAGEWILFANRIEDAGADALELNVSLLPSDETRSSEENEKIYFDIIKKVKAKVSIPVSLKMSFYSSGLARLIQKLSWTKNVDSFVLFNRYYSPDIDINNFKIISSNVFSQPQEITTSLRWIALLSEKVKCDLIASTGIHSGEGVVKQILAGATAVQIVSAIYKKSPEYITTILNELKDWMKNKGFNSLDEFRGKMSNKKVENPAAFERVQFMKYFGGIV